MVCTMHVMTHSTHIACLWLYYSCLKMTFISFKMCGRAWKLTQLPYIHNEHLMHIKAYVEPTLQVLNTIKVFIHIACADPPCNSKKSLILLHEHTTCQRNACKPIACIASLTWASTSGERVVNPLYIHAKSWVVVHALAHNRLYCSVWGVRAKKS